MSFEIKLNLYMHSDCRGWGYDDVLRHEQNPQQNPLDIF